MIPEKDIIKLCHQNDRLGQKTLFESYGRKVMSICLRYSSRKTEADDIFQETFIKIFDSILKKEAFEIRSLAHWISRVTTNTAINMYRKVKRDHSVQLDDLSNYETPVAEEAILERLHTHELISLIQEMPNGYRTVFNLVIIDGYDHRETGKMLGISESASRSQLTRAKAWLREKISEQNCKYERAIG